MSEKVKQFPIKVEIIRVPNFRRFEEVTRDTKAEVLPPQRIESRRVYADSKGNHLFFSIIDGTEHKAKTPKGRLIIYEDLDADVILK